jgi:SAM-dependent methyltransferase
MSDEWEVRNEGLARHISDLVATYAPTRRPLQALDVGTQHGVLPALISGAIPGIQFRGVEPSLPCEYAVLNGIPVERASCDALPYPDAAFDVVTLASVFEHLPPNRRIRGLSEIHRVLDRGGVLVGQIPNMNFPIELHSRLPFQQYLPRSAANGYLRVCSPVSWRVEGTNWFRVGPGVLRNEALLAGFRELYLKPYNPPREALPTLVQSLYPLLNLIPLGFAFVFSA